MAETEVREHERRTKRGFVTTVNRHNRKIKGIHYEPQDTTGAVMNPATGRFDDGRIALGDDIPAGRIVFWDKTDLVQERDKSPTTLGRTEGSSFDVEFGKGAKFKNKQKKDPLKY